MFKKRTYSAKSGDLLELIWVKRVKLLLVEYLLSDHHPEAVGFLQGVLLGLSKVSFTLQFLSGVVDQLLVAWWLILRFISSRKISFHFLCSKNNNKN